MKNFLYISIAVFFFLSGCAREAVKEKDAEQQVTVDDARILGKDGFADTQKQKRLLIPFTLNGKVGFIDQDMKTVYPAEFTRLLGVSGGFALVQKNEGNTWGKYLINSYGNRQKIDSFYDFDFLPDGWCYVYAREKTPYDPELDLGVPQGSTMIVNVISGEKKLLPHVHLLTSSTIDYINAVITDPESPHLFRNTYVNIEGKPVFSNIYRSVCGYFSVDEDATYISSDTWRGDFRILTKQGEIREKYIFDKLDSFYSGLAFGIRSGDNACGFFDAYGELKIPVKVLPGTENDDYRNYHFEESILPTLLLDGDLYAVFDGQEYASNNWCLINTDAKVIKSGIEASYISPFYKGISKVRNGSGKYALMKNDAAFISDFIFDEVGLFSHYFIKAKYNGEDVLVDRKDGRMFYCKDF